jgi:hypothetical protein
MNSPPSPAWEPSTRSVARTGPLYSQLTLEGLPALKTLPSERVTSSAPGPATFAPPTCTDSRTLKADLLTAKTAAPVSTVTPSPVSAIFSGAGGAAALPLRTTNPALPPAGTSARKSTSAHCTEPSS